MITSFLTTGGPVVWILVGFSLIGCTIFFIKLWQFQRFKLERCKRSHTIITHWKNQEQTQALELADLSRSFGVKCMIGCMLEGPISVAAGVHVASAKADVITMLDLDAVSLLASHPVDTTIVFNESEIILSEDIGLGVTYTNHTFN